MDFSYGIETSQTSNKLYRKFSYDREDGEISILLWSILVFVLFLKQISNNLMFRSTLYIILEFFNLGLIDIV